MKEAKISRGPQVEIVDSPIPQPGHGQVVIKVVVSGSNPKDWKMSEFYPDAPPMNQGDDIAGTIYAVGQGVTGFRDGDRVAAFHEMMSPHGSYAEYALAWAHTTFFLPEKTSFEGESDVEKFAILGTSQLVLTISTTEGAAIPLAAMTAAIGLYAADRLALPQPWSPANKPTPLVVYGASSAVGSYVLQLAQRSNVHPLICVAGRAQDHVEKFIDRSKGDTIVDYRKGDDAVVQGIKDALKGAKLEYAYDAVSEKSSPKNLAQVLDATSGKVTSVLPPKGGDFSAKFDEFPQSVYQSMTMVGSVHEDIKDFGFVYFQYFTRGLQEGWFKPQPQEVVPGGLAGIQSALERLKDGTASAVKYVFRISETEGAGSGK